jgi:hypothetical protein
MDHWLQRSSSQVTVLSSSHSSEEDGSVSVNLFAGGRPKT